MSLESSKNDQKESLYPFLSQEIFIHPKSKLHQTEQRLKMISLCVTKITYPV